jgi:hypothetical protein
MSARPETFRCKALTNMSALAPEGELVTELICSLMMSDPISNGTVWFGAPVTVIDCPFTTRFAMFDPPATEGLLEPQACAVALDVSTEALIPTPTAVTLTLATDAWEEVRSKPPVVVDVRRLRASTPGMLALASWVDSDPPELGRAPVSEMEALIPNTLTDAPNASPV